MYILMNKNIKSILFYFIFFRVIKAPMQHRKIRTKITNLHSFLMEEHKILTLSNFDINSWIQLHFQQNSDLQNSNHRSWKTTNEFEMEGVDWVGLFRLSAVTRLLDTLKWNFPFMQWKFSLPTLLHNISTVLIYKCYSTYNRKNSAVRGLFYIM